MTRLWNLDSVPEIPTRCPACPDLPEVYVALYCGEHQPCLAGSSDEIAKAVLGQDYLSGGGEAGGEAGRAICGLIHGPHRAVVLEPIDNPEVAVQI